METNERLKYNVQEEAPKWNWQRLWFGLPPEKREKPWPEVGHQPASRDDPDWRGVVANNVIDMHPDALKPYPFGQPTPDHYFWFDTPDYADPFKKLWSACKIFGNAAFLFGTICGVVQKENTLRAALRVYPKFGLPIFLGGMVGSVSVVTIANLRGKADDIYNYAPGGAIGGAVMFRRWWQWCFAGAVGGAILAVIFKHNAEINGSLIPVFNPRRAGSGLTGMSGKRGPATGDMTFGLRADHYGVDPGRDQRVNY